MYFHDSEGKLVSVPTGWTDLAAEDWFVQVSKGRSLFRVEDLLELRALMDAHEERSRMGPG